MTSVSIETENYDMSNLTTLPQVTVIVKYTYVIYLCYIYRIINEVSSIYKINAKNVLTENLEDLTFPLST